MKRVKITANELDQAEAWLKDIDYKLEDVPMLLASYGRDVKVEKFPALLNLSDEIGNLAEKIKGIQYCDFVSISLSKYNELRDFKERILSLFHGILNSDQKKYHLLSADDLADIILKRINKPVEIKNEPSNSLLILVVVSFFVLGIYLGCMLNRYYV